MFAVKSFAVAATILAGSIAGSASASTVVASACTSVASAAGCKFDGNINGNASASNANSYLSAQNAYNLFNNGKPAAGPDITLNYLGDTDAGFPGLFTGAGGTAGSWSLNGYLVDYVAVKAGASFVLFKLASPASSGAWSTVGLTNKQGQLQNLSHLAFFGSAATAAVPEPASWAMMIGGLGMVGGTMRRRKTRTALSFA